MFNKSIFLKSLLILLFANNSFAIGLDENIEGNAYNSLYNMVGYLNKIDLLPLKANTVDFKTIGSAFMISKNSSQKKVLVSAAHVAKATDYRPRSIFSLIFHEDFKLTEIQTWEDLAVLLVEKGITIQKADGEGNKRFTYFSNSDLLTSESAASGTSKGTLKLRDLTIEPLIFNEHLYVLGLQFGKEKTIECRFKGYNLRRFKELGDLQMYLKCEDLPWDGYQMGLGGVSGGATVDLQGRAVGAFNGYIGNQGSTDTVYLRATPLYETSIGEIIPRPEFLDGLICYNHNGQNPSGLMNIEDFDIQVDSLKSFCE